MILCSGAFDCLHAGHVRYLQRAKALDPTQTLRVAIAPDAYIRSAKKREPWWPQADRALTVFALGCVDDVVLQQSDSVAEVVLDLKPSMLVKGPDWKRDGLPDDVMKACFETGTQIVFVDTPGKHVREAR